MSQQLIYLNGQLNTFSTNEVTCYLESPASLENLKENTIVEKDLVLLKLFAIRDLWTL